MFNIDFQSKSHHPVLVIGSAGVDIIGRLTAALEPGTSNPAQIRTTFGGVARNVAENLARLGQDVVLITAVGNDRLGKELIRQAEEAGVDTSAILVAENVLTGSYLAVVDQNGELQFALDDMQAIEAITPQYLEEQESRFNSASFVLLDANLPIKTIRKAMSLARKAKVPVIADPTSNKLAPKLVPYLGRLFMITPNVQEAALFIGKEFDPSKPDQAVEAAKNLVVAGVAVAIVSLGEYGVSYATSETSGYIPAIRTPIIDPTGAGDALTAAVLFALLNGISLDDAIRLGVSASSLTLRYPGAVVPDLSLEKLYDQLIL